MPVPPSQAASPRDVMTGVGLMVGALFTFTLLDASAKWAMRQGVPPLEVVWVRYVGAMILVFLTAAPGHWREMIRSNRPWMQALRSAFLFGSTLLNFLALQTLQLAETMSIQFSMPLLVALAAGPLLGEWIGPRRLIAVLVGFLGVLVVTRPGVEGFKPATLYSVAGVFCYASYILTTRLLAQADAPRTALLHSTFVGVVAIAPAMPAIWAWPHGAGAVVALGALAVFGAFGHWLIILAHRRAPAGALAPFVYVQIVFMAAAGWLFFGDRPGPNTLAGAAIVIASGLYLLARERKVRGG